MDVISKNETANLLKQERRRAASVYTTLFTTPAEREPLHPAGANIELKREIAHLGIEAYRRRLTSKSDLAALVPKLQLSGLTSAKLLQLAEAAR